MTLKKKIGWTAGILLVLIVGICIGGSLYLIDFSLRPENRGKNMEESEAFMRTEYPQIVPWLDSLQQHHALRDTFITAPDGIRMHAFYARASPPYPTYGHHRTRIYGQCHPYVPYRLPL